MRRNAHPRMLCPPARHVSVTVAAQWFPLGHGCRALHFVTSAPRLGRPPRAQAKRLAAVSAKARESRLEKPPVAAAPPRARKTLKQAPAAPSSQPSPPPATPAAPAAPAEAIDDQPESSPSVVKPTEETGSQAEEKSPAPPQYSPIANPPASTRPPPLDLPPKPDSPSFSHFWATGKAYVTFYKTGLRFFFSNTRQMYYAYRQNTPPTKAQIPSKDGSRPWTPASPPPPLAGETRADHIMQQRWRHDASRAPLFLVLLLVCGEITPVVVIFAPRVAPLTCRIPAQVKELRQMAEVRRHTSLNEFRAKTGQPHATVPPRPDAETSGDAGGAAPAADVAPASTPVAPPPMADLPYGLVAGHLARSLDVISPLWEYVSWVPVLPGLIAGARVSAWLRFLTRDDTLLVNAGGPFALEPEEVELACVDRGIDTLDRERDELRYVLEWWLELTGAKTGGVSDEERARRMMALVMEGEEHWPETWAESRAGGE